MKETYARTVHFSSCNTLLAVHDWQTLTAALLLRHTAANKRIHQYQINRRTQSLSPASPAAGGSMTPQAYKRELERKRRARLRMAQAAAADSTPHEEQESAGNDNSNSNSDADAADDDDDDGESKAQSQQQQQEAPRSSSPLLSPPGNGKSGGVPGALFEGDSPASFVRKQSNPARTAAAAATTAAAAPLSVQPQSKPPVSSPSRQVQFAAVKSTASTSGASLQPHHHGHTVSAPCGPAAAVAAVQQQQQQQGAGSVRGRRSKSTAGDAEADVSDDVDIDGESPEDDAYGYSLDAGRYHSPVSTTVDSCCKLL
jgi:hypothetical protein